jgi:translation initiation factor 2 gamma subunit (eIF-2gamma)
VAIIGIAGHVDHGKSSLVRAFTGMDPDRLERINVMRPGNGSADPRISG